MLAQPELLVERKMMETQEKRWKPIKAGTGREKEGRKESRKGGRGLAYEKIWPVIWNQV